MESLDWNKLHNDTGRHLDSQRISYDKNKHLFRKIAFDVFQLNTTSVESLWKLEAEADGSEYLVAIYGDNSQPSPIQITANWKAYSDSKSENVTLMYRDVFVSKFASSEYGFTNDDVHLFKDTLVNKLASDPGFVRAMFDKIGKAKRAELVSAYPEFDEDSKPDAESEEFMALIPEKIADSELRDVVSTFYKNFFEEGQTEVDYNEDWSFEANNFAEALADKMKSSGPGAWFSDIMNKYYNKKI